MKIIVISFLAVLCSAIIYNAEKAFQVSIEETAGISVEDRSGTLVVSGNSKVTLISYSNDSFETVRTDGPFRSLNDGYSPFFVESLDQFMLFGREKARVG